MTEHRHTTRRRRHRAKLAAEQAPCHLCGRDIDWEAPHLDPLSFTIDHVVPLAKGGQDIIENIRPAHRRCNLVKGDGGKDIKARVAFVTPRAW